MLQINIRDNIMEKIASNINGKPINQNIKPKYIGCLIFE